MDIQLPTTPNNRFSSGGFSFLEIVVALAILSITMSVLFHSHAELVRAQNRVRTIEGARLLAGRIAGRYWLGDSPAVAAANEGNGWIVEYRPAEAAGGTNQIAWECWTISASNNAIPKTELFLRRRETSAAQKSP